MTPATRPAIAELGKPGTITVAGSTPSGARAAAAASSAPASRCARCASTTAAPSGRTAEIQRAGRSQALGDAVGRLERPLSLGRAVVGDPDVPELEVGVRGRDRDGARRSAQQAQPEHGVDAEVARSPVGSHDDAVGARRLRDRDEPTFGPRGRSPPARRPGAFLRRRRTAPRPPTPRPRGATADDDGAAPGPAGVRPGSRGRAAASRRRRRAAPPTAARGRRPASRHGRPRSCGTRSQGRGRWAKRRSGSACSQMSATRDSATRSSSRGSTSTPWRWSPAAHMIRSR